MNYAIHFSPLKKGLQITLSLLLGVALLGNNAAYASGLCVHPSGVGHCYTSIQAAVDAANDGDQIIIRPGKYVEQVTITGKSLTLVGRRGAVIEAPESMIPIEAAGWLTARPIILVTEANVTIRNLTIDGLSSAEINPFLLGIMYMNADGTIQGNVVKNIGFEVPTLPVFDGQPYYMGEAIYVVNFAETPRTVTVTENYVYNYNAGGITVFAETLEGASMPANLTAYLNNNMVVGQGPTDAIDQWGIFLGGYNGAEVYGTIKGNRMRDNITVAPYPLPSIGIASVSTTSNVEIANNVIETANIGLSISGNGTQALNNRFKKMDIGIMLVINDAIYGSALSTVLEDNRFESVPMDVMTGPGAMVEAAALSAVEPAQEQHKRLPR